MGERKRAKQNFFFENLGSVKLVAKTFDSEMEILRKAL